MSDETRRDAIISQCGRYRDKLGRECCSAQWWVTFIMLTAGSELMADFVNPYLEPPATHARRQINNPRLAGKIGGGLVS